jgi:hypothetical protein
MYMETSLLNLEMNLGREDLIHRLLEKKVNIPTDVVVVPVTKELGKPFIMDCIKLRRGKCLIISQKNYGKKNYGDRHGTEKDEVALKRTFQKLGCSVVIEKDLDDQDLLKAVKSFCDKLIHLDPQDLDFVSICLLSHGRLNPKTNEEEIIGVNGKGVPTKELTKIVKKCPVMAGKPKLFFVQACRGLDDNDPVTDDDPKAWNDSGIDSDGRIGSDRKTDVALDSCFLIAHSTIHGYSSFRDREEGSFFIQILCIELDTYGQSQELLSILSRAMDKVQTTLKNLVPIFETCIHKKIYFTPEHSF